MSHYIFQVDEDPEKIQKVMEIMKMDARTAAWFNKTIAQHRCYSGSLEKPVIKGIKVIRTDGVYVDKSKLKERKDEFDWHIEEE